MYREFILVVFAFLVILQAVLAVFFAKYIDRLDDVRRELRSENTELGHLIEWMDNCLPQK